MLVPLAVGAAWAFGTQLDRPFERTVLVVVSTIGLSCAFVDPAAVVTATSPTSLRRRLLVPGTLAVATALAGWVVLRSAAAASSRVDLPDGNELLEWLVVASTQVAVGLALARRSLSVSIGPGAAVATIWATLAAFPGLDVLYPVGDHVVGWVTALLGSLLAAVISTVDPARKPFGLGGATGRGSEQRSLP
jgi:hypothetical protein